MSGFGDFLGGFLGFAAPAIGAAFGGPIGGAIGSAVGSAIEGGNLQQDLTAGATSYFGGSALSGLGGAVGGAAGDAAGGASNSFGSLGSDLGSGLSSTAGAASSGFDQSLFSNTGQFFNGSLGTDAFGNLAGGSVLGSTAGGLTGAGAAGGGISALNNLDLNTGTVAAQPVTLGGSVNPYQPTAAVAQPVQPVVTQAGGSAGSSAAGITGQTPTQASTLLTNNLGAAPAGAGTSGFDNTLLNVGRQLQAGTNAATAAGTGAAGAAGGGGFLNNLGTGLLNFAKKNPLTLAQLGLSAIEGTRTPALPSSLKALQGSALQNMNLANSIIQSGGTSAPSWSGQKATIDAQIDQQIKQGTEAILQNAANSGLGQNSLVVQQQINGLKAQLQQQQQQQYQQVLNSYVSEATSLLTGSDSALGSIGQTQLAQDTQAQQLAAALAGNALNIFSKSSGSNANPLSFGTT